MQGTWPPIQACRSSNWRELKAVHLALLAFAPLISGHAVLIRTDNITAKAYLDKQGGDEISLSGQDLGFAVYLGGGEHSISVSSIHSGLPEHPGRFLEQEDSIIHPFLPPSLGVCSDWAEVGSSSGRSLYFRRQLSGTEVLFSSQGGAGLEGGGSILSLTNGSPLCFSSVCSAFEVSSSSEGGGALDDPGCSDLAPLCLVSSPEVSGGRGSLVSFTIYLPSSIPDP